MNILFLGWRDYAGAANQIARALNEAAKRTMARVATLDAGPHRHREDFIVGEPNPPCWEDLVKFASSADWIISTGDGFYLKFDELARRLPLRSDVKYAAMHAGSAYRRQPEFYNQLDRDFFSARFVGSDLLRFASDNLTIPYYNVGQKPQRNLDLPNGHIVVGHSPTVRERKGTDKILSVLISLSDLVEVDTIENVSHAECLRRRARCHVFVDQMHPGIGGFGASSMEALSVGCAVLADMRHVHERCWTFYPKPPIIDVRDENDLKDTITKLARDKNHLRKIRKESITWMMENASPSAFSLYFLSHLENKSDLRTRKNLVPDQLWWKENWTRPSPEEYKT